MNPFAFLMVGLAGWMNPNLQEAIEYVQEEVFGSRKRKLHDGKNSEHQGFNDKHCLSPSTLVLNSAGPFSSY